jgi:hypothetical protein
MYVYAATSRPIVGTISTLPRDPAPVEVRHDVRHPFGVVVYAAPLDKETARHFSLAPLDDSGAIVLPGPVRFRPASDTPCAACGAIVSPPATMWGEDYPVCDACKRYAPVF